MSESLRQYEDWECGREGYPVAWHSWSVPVSGGGTYFGGSEQHVLSLVETAEAHPPIKDFIREQAGHRCLRCGHPYPPGIADSHPRGEWTPCDEGCAHGRPYRVRRPDTRGLSAIWEIHRESGTREVSYYLSHGLTVEAHWRILTVHHLDEDKANCRWWNLAALCQRCHLRMQRAVVMDRVYHFEHSEWFKPFAAGFYAWKYLGEDLEREETLIRLPELLALEHHFTQEALL